MNLISRFVIRLMVHFHCFPQKELHFDEELVLKQIRYTNMLQMVHIQKSGYSARYTFMVRRKVHKYSDTHSIFTKD